MLEGVRVLEVGDERAEFCGRLLAQAGARVLKVEPPGGSPTRRLPPLVDDGAGTPRSLHWEAWNAGKGSLTLDLDAPDGRLALRRLVGLVDVVVTGMDDPAAVGLDAVAVREANPRAVRVDVTPFGRSGPYAPFRASDAVVFALSGYMNISGRRDGQPQAPPGRQCYLVAGSQGALAAVVALRRRERTGTGEGIEISALECMAAQENLYSTYSARGRVLRRDGSQHVACAPGRIYPCADGFVHIFVGAQKERGVWDRWLEWVGRPAELADPALQDIAVRKQPENLARIDAVAEAFFATRRRDDLVAEGRRRHIPVAPVLAPGEVLGHPHVVERGSVARVGDPGGSGGTVALPRPPWHAGAGLPPERRAPVVGQDTQAVLAADLGASRTDHLLLHRSGTV